MANTNTVTLTILAKNLASNVLNTVSKDLQGLSKTAQNVANDSFNKMGDAFNASATAITVGAGAIGGALGFLGKSSIDAYSDFEKQGVILDIISEKFNLNGDQAKKLAVTLGKELRIGTNSASESLQYLIRSGLTLDQSADLLRRFTNEAMTGKSSSIDLATAVKNLSFAYTTGNSALGNMSGISENFQAIEEKGLKILQSKGKYLDLTVNKLNDAQTMEARYAGMIDLTNLTMGSSERLMGTYSDNISILGANFSELQIAIGKVLGKGLNPFLFQLTKITSRDWSADIDNLTNSFKNLYDLIFKDEISGPIFGLVEDSLPIYTWLKFRDLINPMLENLKKLNDQFKITDGLLFGLSGTIGILVFGGLATLVTSVLAVTYPFIILAGILAGLYTAWQNQDSIIQTLIGWWNQFITILNNFIKFISETFKPELETLNVIWNTLVSVFNSLLPVLGFVIATIYILATQILSALFYAIEQLRQPMHDFIQAVFELAKPIIEILGPAFMVLVAIITGILIPTFQIVWAIVVQAFKGILETITGVIKIISGILNVFIGLIKGLFTGDFSQAAEGFKQIWEGLVSFFWGLIDIILAPIRGMIDGIINLFKGVDLAKIGIEMMNGLVNSLWAMKDKVMEPVWNTVNSIKNAFSNIKMPNIQMPKFANGGVVPKYATGGIIGGSSNTGDRVLARVNSGEMVLNKNQQAELFALANGGGMSKGSGQELKVEVNFNGTFLGSERDKFEFLTFIEDQLAIKIKQITQTV